MQRSIRNGSFRLFRGWLLSTTARIVPNVLTTLAIAGLIIGSTPRIAFAIDVGATPKDGKVVAGSADFSNPSLNNLIINQKTQRVVIDWESFNIGTQASTEFKQPKSNSLAVNRVTGSSVDPTQILGTLSSNGRVMILDSNGV
ncbi:MAG: filamentous hemagglutinin N-terminal domain-containing protein, partial [Alphaproteobacteria bacterium]|nr:filamentous hemagglutinin N-terminal domain-containing protein [Alphaproteobacteria bacterium]